MTIFQRYRSIFRQRRTY